MTTNFLSLVREDFCKSKALAEKAMSQLSDDELQFTPDAETNSIAIIVKHMAGNMKSRWTNFLTTDGEKPDRYRDREFEEEKMSRAELFNAWETGWKIFLDAIDSLNDSDLDSTVYIRGEAHSVMKAILRQHSHYNYHIGQIVQLAKMIRKGEWETLSIPRILKF